MAGPDVPQHENLPQGTIIRQYIDPSEVALARQYYEALTVTDTGISFPGMPEVRLNINKGMENDVKLLISQLIVRGISFVDRQNFMRKFQGIITRDTGLKPYKTDPNMSEGFDLQIDDGIFMDTTILHGDALEKLFQFTTRKGSLERNGEQSIVGNMLKNLVHTVLEKRAKK